MTEMYFSTLNFSWTELILVCKLKLYIFLKRITIHFCHRRITSGLLPLTKALPFLLRNQVSSLNFISRIYTTSFLLKFLTLTNVVNCSFFGFIACLYLFIRLLPTLLSFMSICTCFTVYHPTLSKHKSLAKYWAKFWVFDQTFYLKLCCTYQMLDFLEVWEPPQPFDSRDWSVCQFSTQFHYAVRHTSIENEHYNQLKCMILIERQILMTS